MLLSYDIKMFCHIPSLECKPVILLLLLLLLLLVLLPLPLPADCECMFFAAQNNLALNKVAYQYTTYQGLYASYACDGYPNTGSCTKSWWNNPWWAVDLGAPYDVEHVIVTNDANGYYGNWSRTHCIDSLSTTHCNITRC